MEGTRYVFESRKVVSTATQRESADRKSKERAHAARRSRASERGRPAQERRDLSKADCRREGGWDDLNLKESGRDSKKGEGERKPRRDAS